VNTIAGLLLVAAFLPWVCTLIAKAGGAGFDNNAPRIWLATQQGWRARANAAQKNLFEGLPLFYLAVLWALLYRATDESTLVLWMLAWLALRVAYIAAYLADRGILRSLLWTAALAVNVWMGFGAG